MSEKQKPPFVSFAFHIKQDVTSYEKQTLLGTKFDEDVVPPGEDPVAYLRRRVLAELDRVTLSAPEQAEPGTIKLPGFEDGRQAAKTEDADE